MTNDNSPQILLQWMSCPLIEEPKKGLIGSVVVCFIVWLIHITYGELHLTILSMLFLVGSLSRLFFPTTYKLYDTHILIQGLIFPHKRFWKEFRRLVKYNDCVLLSPFPEPSRLDPYRGVNISFRNNREKVLEILEQKIAKPESK